MNSVIVDSAICLQENSMLKAKPYLIHHWDFKRNSELGLDIYKITFGSGKKAWWNCPKCKSNYDMVIAKKSRGDNCPYCSGNRVNHTNSLASLRPDLASEWHPTKNGAKTPHDVTFGSKQKVWWTASCGHEWKSTVDNRNRGRNCSYCSLTSNRIIVGFNDMWTTNPELAKLLLSTDDGYKYTKMSDKKVDWKCHECDNVIQKKSISTVSRQGLCCPKCSDGIPFAEKFMYNLLRENNICFEYDREQKWSDGKRYDFYLPEYNWIIETHGRQHYEEGFTSSPRKRSLKEEIENDGIKEQTAIINDISKYIPIDTRKSTTEFISKNIMDSDIATILNYTNFTEIGKLSERSFVKIACDLWGSGTHCTLIIMETMKMSRSTIIKYLKRGTEIGWCSYNPKEVSSENGRTKGRMNNKEIAQLTEDGILIKRWSSIDEASKSLNISKGNISSVCTGNRKRAGGFKWKHL